MIAEEEVRRIFLFFEPREFAFFMVVGVVFAVLYLLMKHRVKKLRLRQKRIEMMEKQHGDGLLRLKKRGGQLLLSLGDVFLRTLFLASVSTTPSVALFLFIIPMGWILSVGHKTAMTWFDWRDAGYSRVLFGLLVLGGAVGVWFASFPLRALLMEARAVHLVLLGIFMLYCIFWMNPHGRTKKIRMLGAPWLGPSIDDEE